MASPQPSVMQTAEQPSPSAMLLSSQFSTPTWMIPSPQIAGVQSLLHSSLSKALPSSHCSSPSTTPSPQTGSGPVSVESVESVSRLVVSFVSVEDSVDSVDSVVSPSVEDSVVSPVSPTSSSLGGPSSLQPITSVDRQSSRAGLDLRMGSVSGPFAVASTRAELDDDQQTRHRDRRPPSLAGSRVATPDVYRGALPAG
jgi:hypothetical protein